MLLFVFLGTLLLAGSMSSAMWDAAERAGGKPTETLERIATTGVLWFAFSISLSWALALTRQLRPIPLLAGAGLSWITAAVLWGRRLRNRREHADEAPVSEPPASGPRLLNAVLIGLALAPLGIWIAFALWKGSLLPPVNHDVLSYHLPKAVMIAKSGTVAAFVAPDPRIGAGPANYELLLADFLLLDSDKHTEWIGTASFLVLLALTAMMARRWWGRGYAHVVAAVLVVAGARLLLLHSTADKNDLLAAVFTLGGALWTARWLVERDAVAGALALVCLVFGVGTKAQGVFQFASVGLVILALWLARRLPWRIRPRLVVLAVLFFVALIIVGGGAAYVQGLAQQRNPLRAFEAPTASMSYGDWGNLWRYPGMVLLAPFAGGDNLVWAFWRGEWWFWPKYELFYSHFGWVISCLAFLLPAVAIWLRRSRVGWETRRERWIATTILLLSIALILPVHMLPLGVFGSFGRYVMCAAPLIVTWTIAPIVERTIGAAGRLRFVAHVLVAFAAIALLQSGYECAIKDRFAPLRLLQTQLQRPSRFGVFALRAGLVADALAGPDDCIAVDGGFDTWLYPVFGERLQRKILFIQPGDGDPKIPEEATWVVVDRAWARIWGGSRFLTMATAMRDFDTGPLTVADARVMHFLSKHPEWELKFADRPYNQAVFHRRSRTPTSAAEHR